MNINYNEDSNHELITAIDKSGSQYPIEKLRAHVQNTPHLAISVFLFYKNKLLLQQRAMDKYHSGGLWTNTCCSHPRWLESPDCCAKRRISEELGFTASVRYFGRINYTANVGSQLYENESAFCYVGAIPAHADIYNFNRNEVNAVRWVELEKLKKDISNNPEHYTKWIQIYVLNYFDLLNSAAKRQPIDAACLSTSVNEPTSR